MKIQSPLTKADVLAGLAKQLEAKWIAQVGLGSGATTGFLLEQLPQLHIVAVDSFESEDGKKLEQAFWHRLGEHHWRCRMKPMRSAEAAREVEDESLDLLVLDGAHDEESVIADIRTWWPKLKDGGMVAVCEFQHECPGVHKALAECFNLLQIAVMPDSVAVIEKRETTLYRIAA